MGLVAIDSLFVITISFSIGHSRAVAISKVWMACGIQISAGIEVTGFLLFAIEQAHKKLLWKDIWRRISQVSVLRKKKIGIMLVNPLVLVLFFRMGKRFCISSRPFSFEQSSYIN